MDITVCTSRANGQLLEAETSDEVDTVSLIENGRCDASTTEVLICPSFLGSQLDFKQLNLIWAIYFDNVNMFISNCLLFLWWNVSTN